MGLNHLIGKANDKKKKTTKMEDRLEEEEKSHKTEDGFIKNLDIFSVDTACSIYFLSTTSVLVPFADVNKRTTGFPFFRFLKGLSLRKVCLVFSVFFKRFITDSFLIFSASAIAWTRSSRNELRCVRAVFWQNNIL